VAIAVVLAAALRLGGLALNNVVVINEAATPLLYALPLSAMLGSLMIMEKARRVLSNPRLPGLIFDPITQAFSFLIGLISGRRILPGTAGGRR
jgi:lipopolysaccharide export system permease protein